jgi:hypothetical protein
VSDTGHPRSWQRRRLLEGAGLAAGTLFLPSLVGDRAARAQGPAKRLVVFYTGHGPVTGRWELRPPGLPATPQSEWELPLGPLAQTDFSKTLQPLYPYRNDVLVLEGLALTSAIADKQGNNHGVATGHRLTGALAGTKHVSFDQYVADAIAVPGRFKYLGFTDNAGDANNAGFYDTAGNPVTLARCDAYYGFCANQFQRVFGSIGATQAAPSGPPTGLALSLARRQASVDHLRAEYQRLASRLGAEDRAKLLLHRDMLADLGKRVAEFAQGGKNLGLKLGRYIKYAETGPNPFNMLKTSPYGDRPGGNYGSTSFGLGPAHSRLLVSLMQAFGVARTSIGLDAAAGTGYMRDVKIEMTGPLPRLRA